MAETRFTPGPVHFHSTDSRFCGSAQDARRFSMSDDEVNCPKCLDNVSYVLSAEATAYVASLAVQP